VDDQNQAVSQAANSGQPEPLHNPTSPTKLPWPYGWVITMSILFGFPASFLIVWQNLKRIGREDVAKKFFIVGGLIVLALGIITVILPVRTGSQSGSLLLSAAFPIWFYVKYFKDWQIKNPKVAKFSWSIVGWALLGLFVFVTIITISILIVSGGK